MQDNYIISSTLINAKIGHIVTVYNFDALIASLTNAKIQSHAIGGCIQCQPVTDICPQVMRSAKEYFTAIYRLRLGL